MELEYVQINMIKFSDFYSDLNLWGIPTNNLIETSKSNYEMMEYFKKINNKRKKLNIILMALFLK